MRQSKFSWLNEQKQNLHGQLWAPPDKPKAVFALVHGMGEHIGRYASFAGFWVPRGVAVIGVDHVGHGKSEGQRGHIMAYKELIDELDQLLLRTRQQFPGTPVYLYGQSLGGALAANYALMKPYQVQGLIVSSPFFRLAFQPSPFRVKLASFMSNIFPSFAQNTGLDTQALSRDPMVVKAYEKDRLVHGRISASMFMAVYKAGLYALQQAATLKIPMLLMHGNADRITSVEASREFAAKAHLTCTYREWDGFYHELHFEPEYLEVLQFAEDWLNEQLNKIKA